MPDPGIFNGMLPSLTRVLGLGWTGLTPEALWLVSQISLWFLLPVLGFALAGHIDVLPTAILALAKALVFVWVVTNLQTLTNGFANVVVSAGLIMGGSQLTAAQFLSPGTILAQGWNTTGPLYAYVENIGSSWWGALTSIAAILIYDLGVLLPMWICFFLMAAHIVVAVIEFQMVALFAVLFIPWGIFSGTAFMAEGAVNGILASGVRLGTLAFVTSALNPWIDTIGRALGTGEEPGVWAALSASAAAGLMMLISWHAPRYASAFFGGAPAFTGATIFAAAAGVLVAGRRLVRG
jgi:type IV secretion system protein TrbL